MRRTVAALALLSLFCSSCYETGPSRGGGKAKVVSSERSVNPADVLVPRGYRVEVVTTGLTFPTGVAFDEQDRPYVVESGYSYGEVWTTPRLLRVEADGRTTPIASGPGAPWNGVAYDKGNFFVAAGGQKDGGQILRISGDGKTVEPIVTGLPSYGDHHTNGPAIGPDGSIYFGQGTATNSAVVGTDNFKFGWLKRRPEFHDIPARDIKLTGQNFTTENPLTDDPKDKAITGAFSPFGTPTQAGQVIKGQVPCTGAVMRIVTGGADDKLEVVAWGLRNPYGLAFAPDGKLYVTENSYDVRGSRPIFGTGDLLWRVEQPGLWYGWPDFHGDLPLTKEDHFTEPGKPAPKFLLAEHPNDPPKPVAKFGVHSSSNGFDFSRNDDRFGYAGEAFVAQFGDMSPGVGKVVAPVGFKVVRVDVRTGVIRDFATNRGKENGPASRQKHGGLERPNAVRFNRAGDVLYVVDFGVMTIGKNGPEPRQGTGVLWRITRAEATR
jgi:glucose/arabinose dehydrogenase